MRGFAIGAWLAIIPSALIADRLGLPGEVAFVVGLGQALALTAAATFTGGR